MSVRQQLLYLHPEICKRLRGCSGNCYDVFLFLLYSTNGGLRKYYVKKKELAQELECSVRAVDKSLAMLVHIKAIHLLSKLCYSIHDDLYSTACCSSQGEAYIGAKIVWYMADHYNSDDVDLDDIYVQCRIYYEGKQTSIFPIRYDEFMEFKDNDVFGFIRVSPLPRETKERLGQYSHEVIPATTPKLEDPSISKRHKIKADRPNAKKPSTSRKSGICSPEKQPNTGNSKQREKSSKPQTKPQASNIPQYASLPADYAPSPVASFYAELKKEFRKKYNSKTAKKKTSNKSSRSSKEDDDIDLE